jgi:hypothetical protein
MTTGGVVVHDANNSAERRITLKPSCRVPTT